MTKSIITCLGAFLLSTAIHAADAKKTIEDEVRGAGFGFGVGAVYMFGEAPVNSATIDSSGIVRVTEDSAARVGAIFEAHFLTGSLIDAKGQEELKALTLNSETDRKAALEKLNIPDGSFNPQLIRRDFAHGPMVTAELGENVVRSFGVGWVWSWRRFTVGLDSEKKKINSLTRFGTAFNLGFSVLIEPKVKTLPDGFEKNTAAPSGMTTIPLEEKERLGAALVFSATF